MTTLASGNSVSLWLDVSDKLTVTNGTVIGPDGPVIVTTAQTFGPYAGGAMLRVIGGSGCEYTFQDLTTAYGSSATVLEGVPKIISMVGAALPAVVTATPGSGGTIAGEYTTSSAADVSAGTASWSAWPYGSASSETTWTLTTSVTAIRMTAATADGSVAIESQTDVMAALSIGGSQYIAAAPRDSYAQISVGSFGDSIANVSGSFANQDTRQISAASCGFSGGRMIPYLNKWSGGALRPVFNGGVSGETTTQMLARDAAGASSTRKAISDAATSGVRFLVIAAGINDLTAGLSGGESSSAIAAVVATPLANILSLARRAVSKGHTPIVTALCSYTAGSASKNAAVQSGIALLNASLKSAIDSAGGVLGYYVDDFFDQVVDSSGAWIAGMDGGDGLHPSANGCELIYAPVAQKICSLAGVPASSPICYPVGANLISNPDFSATSGGVATGLSIYQMGTSAVTLSTSVVLWRGQMWQQVICTPTGLDANGNAGVEIDVSLPSASIASGDVLGGEISVYIDDGSGGPPSEVFQYLIRTRTNSTYADMPLSDAVISPKVGMKRPIDGRFAPPPIVSPASSPATALLSVAALSKSLTPWRMMICRPRLVKLSAGY